jgi:type I restriction enzyme S subunit
VPLPPLNEQRRIVAAIEELFSRLDPGEQCLRMARTKATSIGGRIARHVIDNATGSVVETLEAVCPVFVDCAHRTPVYSEAGVPALRPRDVVGGVLNLQDAARVGAQEFSTQTRRRVPQTGDVVYSRELSYGWAVVVPPDGVLCLSQGMVLFRPDDSVSADYLALVLNSPIGRDQAAAAAVGTAHPHINLRDIRQYRIPIPSLREQKRIAEDLQQRSSILDAASAGIDRAFRRSTGLRRTILERAFRGDLVTQDPVDEPASVLLARIAADPSRVMPQQRRKATA